MPLVVKAAAGQTANITEWQDSAGGILAFIDASGDVDISQHMAVGGSASVDANNTVRNEEQYASTSGIVSGDLVIVDAVPAVNSSALFHALRFTAKQKSTPAKPSPPSGSSSGWD